MSDKFFAKVTFFGLLKKLNKNVILRYGTAQHS